MAKLEAFVFCWGNNEGTMCGAEHVSLSLLVSAKSRVIFTFYAKDYKEASKIYKQMWDETEQIPDIIDACRNRRVWWVK